MQILLSTAGTWLQKACTTTVIALPCQPSNSSISLVYGQDCSRLCQYRSNCIGQIRSHGCALCILRPETAAHCHIGPWPTLRFTWHLEVGESASCPNPRPAPHPPPPPPSPTGARHWLCLLSTVPLPDYTQTPANSELQGSGGICKPDPCAGSDRTVPTSSVQWQQYSTVSLTRSPGGAFWVQLSQGLYVYWLGISAHIAPRGDLFRRPELTSGKTARGSSLQVRALNKDLKSHPDRLGLDQLGQRLVSAQQPTRAIRLAALPQQQQHPLPCSWASRGLLGSGRGSEAASNNQSCEHRQAAVVKWLKNPCVSF